MDMFDMDQNGSIDSYEFVCALSLLSHATLDEKAELIFNLYDFDRSQSISKDELTVLMANTMASFKSMEGKPAECLPWANFEVARALPLEEPPSDVFFIFFFLFFILFFIIFILLLAALRGLFVLLLILPSDCLLLFS